MNGITFFFDWEVAFMQWIQHFANPISTLIASFFTLLGDEVSVIATLGFIYWCYDKEWGKFVGTNAICALLSGPLLKNIVLRRRPYMDVSEIKCLRPVHPGTDINNISIQGYSFPSMHSLNAVSTYGSLAFCIKKRWFTAISVIIIFMIGLSRSFIGVHYPTDIICGWLIGLIMTVIVSFLQKKIKNRLCLLFIFSVLALPGWFYCSSNDFYTSYGLLAGVFLGNYIEEKFVDFKNTKNPVRCILRLIGGIAIFVFSDKILKMPFSKKFLATNAFLPHLVRSVRYFVTSFVIMGVYPIIFKYTAKIGKKSDKNL